MKENTIFGKCFIPAIGSIILITFLIFFISTEAQNSEAGKVNSQSVAYSDFTDILTDVFVYIDRDNDDNFNDSGKRANYNVPFLPPIKTKVDTIVACIDNPDTVVIPVTTENSYNVASISLALNINTAVLNFVSVQNIHPELQTAALFANQVGGAVMISWINPFSEANIGTGTMFELVFSAIPAQSPLSWDVVTQGYCEYTNIQQNVLPAVFIDGNFTGWPLPVADAGPDQTIFTNDCTTLTETGCGAGCTYLWSEGSTTASIIVCPADTTTYIVTVTDANGCTASDEVSVYVITKILTKADSVQICMENSGTVIVPITTENSWHVAGISLALDIDNTILNFSALQNVHPELQSGVLLANQSGSTVLISWIGPFAPANIGLGTMFEIVFNAVTGQSQLSWDVVSQGFCEYIDITQNVLPAEFIDGNFIGLLNPSADAGQDKDICVGECTTLTAAGGVSYLWSNGVTAADNAVCPNDTTTYTVTVTAGNGCHDTAMVTVNVSPVPLVDAGPDATIYLNSCTDLTATSAGTAGAYIWSTGETTATINVCPTITTSYTVTATNIYGCTDSDDVKVSVITGPCISGHVTYLNTAATPMNNTEVILRCGNNIIQTTTTDAGGFYQFISLYDSTFTIDAESTKEWGGANSIDALMIMKHFTGMSLLSGLPLEAADVNADSIVNTLDAMYIAQRFVGMINAFPAGDWVFKKNSITVSGQDEVNNFSALCFGDVNGSYTPPFFGFLPKNQLNNNAVQEVSSRAGFAYTLTESSIVSISLYNAMAEKIAVIINNERKDAGIYKEKFNRSALAPGVYFFRTEIQSASGSSIETRPMVISE